MTLRILRALVLPLAGLLTMLGLFGLAVPAKAKSRFVENIGLITGYYGGGDYTGLKQPAWDGFCVEVQRKDGSGTWTTYAVNSPTDCSASNGSSAWSITGNTAAPATQGIRLVNLSSGAGFNICSDKPSCQAM